MLIDSYGREVDYLRISVTERCNFRCLYCMPEKPFSWTPKENLLSYEELFKFVKIAIDKGIKKIRITGGEPLLRENLDIFIKMIFDYKNDIDLALTTNAYLLENSALKLKEAGLKRINISLDTLDKDIAKKLAQKDILENVLKGIEKSIEVGLKVKLNSVLFKDINEKELFKVFEFAKKRDIPIRFIEFMSNSFAKDLVGIDIKTILENLKTRYNFTPVEKNLKSPARYFTTDDNYIFGVIEPYKDDFCQSCNRIRLTAEGFLIPCLYFDEAKSIKEAIKDNDLELATKIFESVIKDKPEKNRWEQEESTRGFFQTGG